MRRTCLLLAGLMGASLLAQIEEGKAGKYYTHDPAEPVAAGAYPELTIEDLRKLTMFSKLAIRETQVAIADDAHVRSIETHPQDKDLLIVTSDHFRWTTFKNGWVDRKALPKREVPHYGFIWIKHATRESPNGKPWLKDLVLLPYDKKTGKFAAPWPFGVESAYESSGSSAGDDTTPKWDTPCFLKTADPRPRRAGLPDETGSVLGTFSAGKMQYLVIDTFGGYSWWGRIMWTEYFPLRGRAKAPIDAFHGQAARSSGKPRFVVRPYRLPGPGTSTLIEVLGATADEAGRLLAQVPNLVQAKAQTEKLDGWEDMLELDTRDPLPAIESAIKELATLADALVWTRDYAERHNGSSSFFDWSMPLKQLLVSNERGHVTTARVLRYVFRRLGFPCVFQGYIEAGKELFPRLSLHVYVPSQDVSWIVRIGAGWNNVVMRPASRTTWDMPQFSQAAASRRGLPIFDCMVGCDEKPRGGVLRYPVPPSK